MTSPTEHQLFERLIHRFAPGATLLRAWQLSGGVSARVTALEIVHVPGARPAPSARQSRAGGARAEGLVARTATEPPRIDGVQQV